MQKDELRKYKSLLEAKLTQLANPLDRRAEIAIQKTPDLLDAVQLTAERELALHDVSRCATLGREIRAALKRIDQGAYGVCLNCEAGIAAKRLDAVPWAAYCVNCQEAAERDELQSVALAA
jgi:DnaK suppressor protein